MLNLVKDEYKKVLLFAVVLFYLVGPVFRVAHAYLSDIFFAVVFVLLFLSGVKLNFSEKFSKLFLMPAAIVLICTAGKLLSRFTLGGDEIASMLNYVKLYFLFILTYSVFTSNNRSELLNKDLKVLNYIILFFVLFVSAIGILQFVGSPAANFILTNLYHVVHTTGSDNLSEFAELNRVTSIFDSFNGFGIVLCFSLFMLAFINSELKNYFGLFVILIGIGMIVLTGNRASLLTFFFMTLVYFVSIKQKFSKKKIGIGFGVIALAGIIFYFAASNLSIYNFFRYYEFALLFQKGDIPHTIGVRLVKWEWIPQHMASVKQMLFGYTTNDFIKDRIYDSPDSQYLNWLVYLGYVGAVLFITWIFYTLISFFKRKQFQFISNISYLKKSNNFFIVYWIGLILIGVFQESFFFGRLRELFIFFLAFNCAYANLSARKISET